MEITRLINRKESIGLQKVIIIESKTVINPKKTAIKVLEISEPKENYLE